MEVFIERCIDYDFTRIREVLRKWEPIFRGVIQSGNTVVIKPNWIAQSHKYDEKEWISVITHPDVITAVLATVLNCLNGRGKVVITDGPQTSSSWQRIMDIMQPERWIELGAQQSVEVSVMDLRDDEWTVKGDLIVDRKKLQGDPLGSTVCNLGMHSQFVGKINSPKGYFGADYDSSETNEAHANGNHLYKVSRTVMEADVFINLPKLKTHKKAGITCSLKNLVGINTYKNWLPHHTVGTPSAHGDQYPEKGIRSITEGTLLGLLNNALVKNPHIARYLIPVKRTAKLLFGDTRKTVRSGGWYGNDTLWRTILDLNKVLLYANEDGTLRADSCETTKKYITLVDAITSGEKNGPEAPDRKDTGLLVLGTDPVSVDAVCAKIMGFDWKKIPAIKNSLMMETYPICNFSYDDIYITSSQPSFNKKLSDMQAGSIFRFSPPNGWAGNIEEL